MEKGLLTQLGEVIDRYKAERQSRQRLQSIDAHAPLPQRFTRILSLFLPNFGTLILIAALLMGNNAGAFSLFVPNTATQSTGTIAYQGRLADSGGSPITATVNMIFRLYAAASGGAPLWEEQWTGANSVQVSDGLFNVMLGSLTSIPQSVITGNPNLFLGITVGTDSEMSPRVQLGSVPFATQALTVPDGSITTAKLADGAVTSVKLEAGVLTNQSVNQANIIANVQSAQGDTEKSVSATGYVDLLSIPLQLQESSTLRITFQGLVWKIGGAGRTALGIRMDGSENTDFNNVSWLQAGTPVTTNWIVGSYQLSHTWFTTVAPGTHTVTLVLGSWDGGTSYARSYSTNVEVLKSP